MTVRVGQSMPRLEDIRLLQGQGRYTDDIAPNDALWACVVRSPHAHAAALLLKAEHTALAYGAGRFSRADGTGGVSLFDIVTALRDGALPRQMGNRLSVVHDIKKRIPAHPTGCGVCEVEVDPRTGTVAVLAYSSVDDVGRAINPLVVDGQVLSASFMDYSLPRADMLPSISVRLAEDPMTNPDNPFTVKGAGEGGLTPGQIGPCRDKRPRLGGDCALGSVDSKEFRRADHALSSLIVPGQSLLCVHADGSNSSWTSLKKNRGKYGYDRRPGRPGSLQLA